MAQARTTAAIPSVIANKQAAQLTRQRVQHVEQARAAHGDKTFGQLSNPQKDQLLKAMAIKLGLILPD
jgi:hypothetical protein